MQRKHRVQMNEQEIECAEFVAHSTVGWSFGTNVHLSERMSSKRIIRDDVIDALQAGTVIEAKDDNRIVMRSDSGVVAVADLRTKEIVTAWRNSQTDNHSTLDLSEYTWQVDLNRFMRRFV